MPGEDMQLKSKIEFHQDPVTRPVQWLSKGSRERIEWESSQGLEVEGGKTAANCLAATEGTPCPACRIF